MEEPSFAPYYAMFLQPLTEVAREHGYALAVHGTMNRDLDVVCIPWTLSATSADTLINALQKRCGGIIPDGDPISKPHGRIALNMIMGGHMVFDISIMPRQEVG